MGSQHKHANHPRHKQARDDCGHDVPDPLGRRAPSSELKTSRNPTILNVCAAWFNM
jgi:hypothetical protein